MSQAEQVPEDMPAYLNDEPVATGKFSRCPLTMSRAGFVVVFLESKNLMS